MSNWRHVPAGKFARQRRELIRLEPGNEYRTMGVRWYSKGAYDRGVVTTETVKAKALYRARKGDFTFNRIDTQKGAFDVVSAELDGALATNEFPLYELKEEEVDARFLLLNFQRPEVLWQISAMRAGSEGRARWKEADFEAWLVPVPPLPVQERIVEVIGAVDDQIDALNTEADLLDEMWWALGREMAAALADEETVPLASFCDISGGLTKNKKDLEQSDLVEVPYLRVANVHRHHLNLSEVATIQTTRAKADKLRLRPGDILMNEGGDKDKLGRGHVWEDQIPDCIHQNHVFRVRVTDQRFDPYFVSAWGNTFGQEWFATFGTQTTGIASINRATLGGFPIPDVQLFVQQDWAERLRMVVEMMDSLRRQADSLRETRACLVSGLLNQSITIDVEPAELEV